MFQSRLSPYFYHTDSSIDQFTPLTVCWQKWESNKLQQGNGK